MDAALQVAQQLSGTMTSWHYGVQGGESVRITLARKEEPSSWVLRSADDTDPSLRALQDELIPVR